MYLTMSEATWLAFLAANAEEMEKRGYQPKAPKAPKAPKPSGDTPCPDCGKMCRGPAGVEAHLKDKHGTPKCGGLCG